MSKVASSNTETRLFAALPLPLLEVTCSPLTAPQRVRREYDERRKCWSGVGVGNALCTVAKQRLPSASRDLLTKIGKRQTNIESEA